jgi:hypothetical protein
MFHSEANLFDGVLFCNSKVREDKDWEKMKDRAVIDA